MTDPVKLLSGFERNDGSFGVRNHVAVMPSVSCANGVVASICQTVPELVPFYHGIGCGRGGEADLVSHPRTLQNICRNPNIGAVLIVGLGCELINAEMMAMALAQTGKTVEYLIIQKEGGSRKSSLKGIDISKKLLAQARSQKRVPFPVDRLIVGLECGGSDALSGVTANPGVGKASDWIVDQGGTVILTETTEMIGTAHILAKRAKNEAVAEKIKDLVSRAKKQTQDVLGPFAQFVIAPGNMDGGMSSIKEKALGCIIKAGTRKISQVIDYAEMPTEKGVVIMNGPGYDTESLTGLAAAGAQIIVFTTGRGNPIGHPACPVIKVASNTAIYDQMADDMDINAGEVVNGMSIEDLGTDIRNKILQAANGELTKAEINNQNGIVCVYTQTVSF